MPLLALFALLSTVADCDGDAAAVVSWDRSYPLLLFVRPSGRSRSNPQESLTSK